MKGIEGMREVKERERKERIETEGVKERIGWES